MDLPLIDLHQHVIFGMDDGPKTEAETFAMLETAEKQGVVRIIATSHSSPLFKPFDCNAYLDKINHLNRQMRSKKWVLRLMPGAEIYYTSQTLDQLNQKQLPTLAMGQHVLIEFSPQENLNRMLSAFRELLNGGYRPILAHVERYQCLYGQWNAIKQLQEMHVLLQMNARTVLESNALFKKHFSRKLLEEGAVDFIATDAHNTATRPVNLKDAYDFIDKHYGKQMADQLCFLNQSQLI